MTPLSRMEHITPESLQAFDVRHFRTVEASYGRDHDLGIGDLISSSSVCMGSLDGDAVVL